MGRVGVRAAHWSWSDPFVLADGRGDVESGLGMVVGAMRIEETRPRSGSNPDSPCHRELREVDGGCESACERGQLRAARESSRTE
jgi:hypothetical protein